MIEKWPLFVIAVTIIISISLVSLTYGLISILVIFIIFIIWIFNVFLNNYLENKVKGTSQLYNDLIALNKSFEFYDDIDSFYILRNDCSSLDAYKRRTGTSIILKDMSNDLSGYGALISKTEENAKKYYLYKKEYEKLYTENLTKVELRLYKKYKLKPITSFYINTKITYVTPAERNRYIKEDTFGFDKVVLLYNNAKTPPVTKPSSTTKNTINIINIININN